MPIKLAVCDDSMPTRLQICDYLKQMECEYDLRFDVQTFSSAAQLLERMSGDTQILLLDIAMDSMTGMEAARILRERGANLCIIFITSMVQYALEGYGVRAFGFLKKPLQYTAFAREVCDALESVEKQADRCITLRVGTCLNVLKTKDILYAEILGRELKILTTDGSQLYTMPMRELESLLPAGHFFRCHKSYLVNFHHILNVDGADILLSNQQKIPISKHRRKEFMQAFISYIGGHSGS